MADESRVIPMDRLVNTDKNMYELTNAAIHRAEQIAITGGNEAEETEGKTISKAIREIVTEEVKYEFKR
ncbi:DNA-directed RNA polymerase subunit omega [Spirochaeta isovalerica]|uniref:DNA-directed RNA polymerase subunit omega n=1 Tax=Spirochaeta isovalerica TaxID=150 RepID=A0A841RD86_9SPIO|nr:DNA-directed RNA polymerase subunit omega [Spirochaeta isovalerica]MBB6480819.1 DNA-directed RNA polymerase subunit omega [Spirochaeta isovalerica]